MNKMQVMLGVAVVVLIGGSYLYGDRQSAKERERTAAALDSAAAFSGRLAIANALAKDAMAAHAQADSETTRQKLQAASWLARYNALKAHPPTTIMAQAPDTCAPFIAAMALHLDSVTHAADSTIAHKDTQIASLTSDNAQMASKLVIIQGVVADSSNALANARRELAKALIKTTTSPRKLLGFLTLPQASFGGSVGYGGTYDLKDKQLHTGPSASLGVSVHF